ncbi:MAG: hydroxymethylbilane synthase [Pseudomonadota bacterium]
MKIRIATRKSQLALWQAQHVADLLNALPAIDEVELVGMSTRGDEVLDKSLQKIGGKGLFIKELEVAMQEGRADIAVHSMKDVPAEMPEGFCLAAVLPRANPFDALISNRVTALSDLPRGAVVGSSSLRRQAQLLAMRPDLNVTPLRGNVNTRLKKLDDGHYDAIVLACAGLERLDMHERIAATFSPAEILPAATQGVIGIECLTDDASLRRQLELLEDADTSFVTLAERAVARRLGASCQSPVASFAVLDTDELRLESLVASPDGRVVLREAASGKTEAAEKLGETVAERLFSQGAAKLLVADPA